MAQDPGCADALGHRTSGAGGYALESSPGQSAKAPPRGAALIKHDAVATTDHEFALLHAAISSLASIVLAFSLHKAASCAAVNAAGRIPIYASTVVPAA